MNDSPPTPLGREYPPQSLRDYALLADGHRGALIGPRGDVSWLCAPRWDSAAMFSQLIGGRGTFAITPVDTFVWGGYYEPGTLIWVSRWTTTDCHLQCHEALATPSDPHKLVLLRHVEAGTQPASIDVTLDICAEFATKRSSASRDESGCWIIDAGDLHCRFSGAGNAELDSEGVLRLRLDLGPGQEHDFVLEVSDRSLNGCVPVDAATAWSSTRNHWAQAVPEFERSAAPRDSRHAYAVLRGMTAPGGGMVAAATLGLPERANAGKNYDYRYVWLRDQAYAGIAAGVTEPLPLLNEAVAFSTARVLEHGDKLSPAYRIDGKSAPHEQQLDRPGYPGGTPIVGNWVRGQFQLDAMGELLQLYATSARHDHLTSDDHNAITTVISTIDTKWTKPDAGIWELNNDWWTHSRLSCVAGLRAIAAHAPAPDAGSALTLADAILAETSKRCLNPDGAWRQSPTNHKPDAALLIPVVRGALPPEDPRSRATLAAVMRDLTQDGYVYRFRPDERPLGEAEGAFLMCGFAVSLAHLQAGNTSDAFRWFERGRAAPGSPGLLCEEFDVRQRQLRGNMPQAFVHAMLLECSQRLDTGAMGDHEPG